MRDFSSESDPVVLIQLFDRFKRGRVLSDEGTLLEKVGDVRHVSLLREPLDIAQELIFRDTSQGVLNPGQGESKSQSHDHDGDGVDGPGGDVLVKVNGITSPLGITFVPVAGGSAPVLGVCHDAYVQRGGRGENAEQPPKELRSPYIPQEMGDFETIHNPPFTY